ncbi:MAG: acyl--CoA ligase [Desulfobacterales bacterium]|nr:acyl--CoA ligase [Desulfobacterales bacterium]
MLVQHFLENSAERLPDKAALICQEGRLTHREIDCMADRLAVALKGMGVQRGDRVVIFLENTIESVISLFAVLKADAVYIMLNPGLMSKKLQYILDDSAAVALITHTGKARVITGAVRENLPLKHILWTGKAGSIPVNHASGVSDHAWDEALTGAHEKSVRPPASNIDMDLATIIYTSGSTGKPKGVMSAHYNVVTAAMSITRYLENVEDDIILNALPLSFDYGLFQVLMTFLFGGSLVLEKSFAFPHNVLQRLRQENVTGFPIVPTMAAILLGLKNPTKYDFSSLRYITSTAATLPPTHIRKLRSILPHVRIYSMYGLTECKRALYLPPEHLERKTGSVGIPIPNTEAYIVDKEGREARDGEIGELVIRGSHVMLGYWNDPEETARTFRRGGPAGETRLYTGDLFRKDEEGFFYFVSRKDDLIKVKGERVSPKEIEDALCEIDGVAEAAVIGVPDEIWGQVVKAFIVPGDEKAITEKDIHIYCRKNLEPFLRPKQIVFKDAFLKTGSGKIDKKKLAASSG